MRQIYVIGLIVIGVIAGLFLFKSAELSRSSSPPNMTPVSKHAPTIAGTETGAGPAQPNAKSEFAANRNGREGEHPSTVDGILTTGSGEIGHTSGPSTPVSASALPPPTKEMFDHMFGKDIEKSSLSSKPPIEQVEHNMFESQTVDPNWSPIVEQSAKQYFSEQQSAATNDVVSVECRSTTCEILSVTKSPQAAQAAVDQWQTDLYRTQQQAWATAYGIADASVSIQSGSDGRLLVATYLSRSRLPRPSN